MDRTTALHATIGALAALRHRDRTGEGQVVDCCLLDSALTMVEIPSIYYLDTGEEGGEGGRPPYRAKDGWVVISAVGREMVERLLRIIDPGRDPARSSREPMNSSVGRGDDRRRLLESWCAERNVTVIVEILQASGVSGCPCTRHPGSDARRAHVAKRDANQAAGRTRRRDPRSWLGGQDVRHAWSHRSGPDAGSTHGRNPHLAPWLRRNAPPIAESSEGDRLKHVVGGLSAVFYASAATTAAQICAQTPVPRAKIQPESMEPPRFRRPT